MSPLTCNALLAVMAVTVAWGSLAFAEVSGQSVEYRDGDVLLEGYLAYDEAVAEPRPLVLVVHEWWGLNDYARDRARQLAQLGYVAFAVDMYGKGVVATDRKRAGELAGGLRTDRELMRRRALAGLEAVRSDPRVDGGRVGAIGYCFGGTVVLELARSGADLDGVVSFHGGLDTTAPSDHKITAKVLVLTGADDRSVLPAAITGFIDEMRQARANYQINIYGGAVHSFTNPAAGSDPSTNSAYNAQADRRSWEAMKDFLAEALTPPPASDGGQTP